MIKDAIADRQQYIVLTHADLIRNGMAIYKQEVCNSCYRDCTGQTLEAVGKSATTTVEANDDTSEDGVRAELVASSDSELDDLDWGLSGRMELAFGGLHDNAGTKGKKRRHSSNSMTGLSEIAGTKRLKATRATGSKEEPAAEFGAKDEDRHKDEKVTWLRLKTEAERPKVEPKAWEKAFDPGAYRRRPSPEAPLPVNASLSPLNRELLDYVSLPYTPNYFSSSPSTPDSSIPSRNLGESLASHDTDVAREFATLNALFPISKGTLSQDIDPPERAFTSYLTLPIDPRAKIGVDTAEDVHDGDTTEIDQDIMETCRIGPFTNCSSRCRRARELFTDSGTLERVKGPGAEISCRLNTEV